MESNLRDLLESVKFIKERMITKDDLAEAMADAEMRLGTKIDRIDAKLGAFQDSEIDKRLQLEVRVHRIETHLGISKPKQLS